MQVCGNVIKLHYVPLASKPPSFFTRHTNELPMSRFTIFHCMCLNLIFTHQKNIFFTTWDVCEEKLKNYLAIKNNHNFSLHKVKSDF